MELLSWLFGRHIKGTGTNPDVDKNNQDEFTTNVPVSEIDHQADSDWPWGSLKASNRLGSSQYSMTLIEFKKIIIPLLLKYPFSSIGYTDEAILLLYNYSDNDWTKRRGAREELAWHHNSATRHTARDLRYNYEALRRAKEDGALTVKIITQRKCQCLEFLDGKTVLVDEMLNAFEGKTVNSPVIPPIETPCAFDQERQDICACTLLPPGPLASAEPISINWRRTMLEKVVDRIVEKIRRADEDIEETSRKVDKFDHECPIENPAEVLARRLSITELRAFQRKLGVSGRRTKQDIAEQLLSMGSAQDDIEVIFKQIRFDNFAWLKRRVEQLNSDKNSLITILYNVKKRLDCQ